MASDSHLAQLMDGAAAWNRWRREEPLVRPDLQGLSLTLAQKQWGQTSGGPINLSQSMLREADLRHATLIDADLSGATLVGADLTGARLRNANMRNANLAHVRFDGADLLGAQFFGADLRGADLGAARNLSPTQFEGASGDAETLLPPGFVPPAGWHNGAVAELRAPVSSYEAAPAPTAEAYFPSVLRKPKPQGAPSADRFGQALHGLSRPRLDTVAVQARRTLTELPRARLDSVTGRMKSALENLPRPRPGALVDRAKAALQSVPRPRFDGIADRSRRAIQSVPRPRPAELAKRAGLALSDLPHPRLIAIAGIAGVLLVFGFGALLAMRGFDKKGSDAATRGVPPPSVVARQQAMPEVPAPTPAKMPEASTQAARDAVETAPQTASKPDVSASPKANGERSEPSAPALATKPAQPEPPQRVAVTEAEETTPVEEVAGSGADSNSVAHVEPEPFLVAPAVPEGSAPEASSDLATKSSEAAGKNVRLAFAMRTQDVTDTAEPSGTTPIVGSGAQAFIQSYVGQPVAAPPLNDTVKRTDLPTPQSIDKKSPDKQSPEKPTVVAKLPPPEPKPKAPPTSDATTSVVEYLSVPNKSSEWIKQFIKNFYLSGEALNEADIRRIYSQEIDYFGKRTGIDKLARETAQYYRDWPQRHYELVPGSIDIKWKSDQIADVSFSYDYKVSAPKKRKASRGRGRAHLTFDLRGHTGLIVREDGEVIAHK